MKVKYDGMVVPDELKEICTVGKYSYADGGSPNIILHTIHSKLTIGNFCSFGPHCNIFLGSEHRTDFVSTFPFSNIFEDVPIIESAKTKGDVVIGSDVWIGAHVTILSGVTIGHGAVIGACAVVAKDVAPYSIVAGNPIKEIRKRFSMQQIEKMLEIQWWEWGDEKIQNAVSMLMGNEIDRFIVKNRRQHADAKGDKD